MVTADEKDRRARLGRARETGLFRYSLVQELTEPGITAAERGRRARSLAGRAHEGPGGQQARVSEQTLRRWRRAYEEGGFDALVPSPRQPGPRTPAEVLALAEALKREKPERTAAQVRRILQVTSGWAPSDRTLQRLFERLELNAPPPGEVPDRALGRFEAGRPNEIWVGDTLHGPVIGGSKSYLFAFLDDHSRAVMGARWAYHDDVVRMAAAVRRQHLLVPARRGLRGRQRPAMRGRHGRDQHRYQRRQPVALPAGLARIGQQSLQQFPQGHRIRCRPGGKVAADALGEP
ncbi:MAG: helix-turn-helix domain-containing protein [Trebonia sp.]